MGSQPVDLPAVFLVFAARHRIMFWAADTTLGILSTTLGILSTTLGILSRKIINLRCTALDTANSQRAAASRRRPDAG